MPDRLCAAPDAPGPDRADPEALWQHARAVRAEAKRLLDEAAALSAFVESLLAQSQTVRTQLRRPRPSPPSVPRDMRPRLVHRPGEAAEWARRGQARRGQPGV
jgi:hypothetical protein